MLYFLFKNVIRFLICMKTGDDTAIAYLHKLDNVALVAFKPI